MQRCVAPRRSALSLLPAARIVRVAPQDHPLHLLAATQHGCAWSKQKHESAQVWCVSPLCAVASRSAARAIRLFNLGHQMRPSPMVGNSVNKRTVASCETCFEEATWAVSLAVLSARCTLIFLGSCCIEPENRLFACLFVCLFVCLLVTSGKQMDLFFWFVMPPHS